MSLSSTLRSSALALALLGLALQTGCVEDSGAAGDYCRGNDQCDEGLICVELLCRDPFDPVDDVDSGPSDDDMFVPDTDLGPGEDMGPEADMGPAEEDMGPAEEDMGPAEEDMGPAEEDMGPAEEDMGA